MHVHFLVRSHLFGVFDELAGFIEVALSTLRDLGTSFCLLLLEFLDVDSRAITCRSTQSQVHAIIASVIRDRGTNFRGAHVHDLFQTRKTALALD